MDLRKKKLERSISAFPAERIQWGTKIKTQKYALLISIVYCEIFQDRVSVGRYFFADKNSTLPLILRIRLHFFSQGHLF